MSAQVAPARDSGVLTLTFGNPPANCLSLALMRGLADAVIAAERDGTVQSHCHRGRGKAVLGGARP